jgi:3-oxoacyl-[acyl-carrier protein] reductase
VSLLAEKVALVTGASRGIGAAIAARFAREGAKLVLVHARDVAGMDAVADLCRGLGADTLVIRADLALPETAAGIADQADRRFGRLDVLVNNAAVVAEDLLPALSDDRLEQMIAVNVAGLTRLTRAAMRPMLRQRSGCVINLSSVAARLPSRGNAVYAGTKGYVEAFTRALAAEVGKKGIRVNAIAPGIVRTAMTEGVRASVGEADLDRRAALGRVADPDDIAGVATFLASDDARYVSGAVIAVDGAYLGGI